MKIPAELVCLLVVAVQQSAQLSLNAAGASFPAAVYKKWYRLFSQQYEGKIDVNYEVIGSSSGKKMIMGLLENENRLVFAASDIQLTPEEEKAFPNLQAFPMIGG